MKLPTELGDKYIDTVLSNFSLEDLQDERWELIEGFENYAISNYGRVKSLERMVPLPIHGEQKILDRIIKPQVFRYFNKHLKAHFYSVRCNLCLDGKVYGRSTARLVYYHFVEKFDIDDHSYRVSFKDENRFNVHYSNLGKITAIELRNKVLNTGRGKKGNYWQAVSQYTVDGGFVASYENIYAASEILGIHHVHILAVINKKRTTAGTFRWFAKDDIPTKKDFIPDEKSRSKKAFNISLWKKIGEPPVDHNNPPACLNLSLEDIPGEIWKPIPNLEGYFAISNKGRIKRLDTWTENKNKTLFRENIISLFVDNFNSKCYLYANLSHKCKRVQIRLNKYLYYCFVKKFDLNDRSIVIINKNEPLWNIDIANLELCSPTHHLNKKK
ncbi:NUMOD4 domain-containing protein [uncultured Chryseobacterium sp.]|uniref:NUMOD4 domain-containing protein n=1 Tax=uncultured Chryseobacterium sp. TaxID=259322 RepID=UPI0025D5A088|nr:NUMOD4 domain-containing protein [uncultured Chryseobacterium sp.]